MQFCITLRDGTSVASAGQASNTTMVGADSILYQTPDVEHAATIICHKQRIAPWPTATAYDAAAALVRRCHCILNLLLKKLQALEWAVRLQEMHTAQVKTQNQETS